MEIEGKSYMRPMQQKKIFVDDDVVATPDSSLLSATQLADFE